MDKIESNQLKKDFIDFKDYKSQFPDLSDEEFFELARIKSRRVFGRQIFIMESLFRSHRKMFPEKDK